MKFLAGVICTLVALGVGALAVIFTGSYDVAATDPHYPIVRWALATTLRNSISAHADTPPPHAFTEADVKAGFKAYDSTCVHCHGAPGVKPNAFTRGMRPRPPALWTLVGKLSPAEEFWVVKHGIKMTGMPGFGVIGKDKDIWKMVAFLQKFSGMNAKDYAAMRQEVSAKATGQGNGGAPAGGSSGSGAGGSGTGGSGTGQPAQGQSQ